MQSIRIIQIKTVQLCVQNVLCTLVQAVTNINSRENKSQFFQTLEKVFLAAALSLLGRSASFFSCSVLIEITR